MLPALLALLLQGVPATDVSPRVIKIYKSDRRMTYEVDGEVERTFTIALGGSPRGDKKRRGDSRTPEGEFYVSFLNPKSHFHRFIAISYPMPRHAKRAFDKGRIERSDRDAIVKAAKRRKVTPQTTRLGGFVGIHGGGVGVDWTLGCIAVTDAEVEWLYRRVKPGDRIIIYP